MVPGRQQLYRLHDRGQVYQVPTAALAQQQQQTFREANGRNTERAVTDSRGNITFHDLFGRKHDCYVLPRQRLNNNEKNEKNDTGDDATRRSSLLFRGSFVCRFPGHAIARSSLWVFEEAN